jgi:hypothetical protein
LHQENSVTVRGVGTGGRSNAAIQTEPGTRLQVATGFVGDAAYIADDDGAARSVARVQVRDLVIDVAEVVEAVSGDPIAGMRLAVRESRLDNLYIASCSGYAIDLFGNAQGDVYNDHMSHIWIREGVGPGGIHFDQYAADWNCLGVIIGGEDAGAGLVFENGGGAGARFTHCNFYNNFINAEFRQTNRLEFIGCSFNDSLRQCMYFNSGAAGGNISKLNFTGCEWRNNGKETDNTYDVFLFNGDVANRMTDINITGGTIEKGNITEEARYIFNKTGSANTALLGLYVTGVWVDVATNFGTGHHNLALQNKYRFLGCGNLQDADVYDAQVGARNKTAVIAGGAAGNHTVTGISIYDRLVSVIHNTAGTLADLTSEFTITATNTINNAAGTDTSSDQLLVIYQDNTP